MLLLDAPFSRTFSGRKGRSSVITTHAKVIHLLGHSAEHALQAALPRSVCLTQHTMVTPTRWKTAHHEIPEASSVHR